MMNNIIINIKRLYGGILLAYNAEDCPKIGIIDSSLAYLICATNNHIVAKVNFLTPNLFEVL